MYFLLFLFHGILSFFFYWNKFSSIFKRINVVSRYIHVVVDMVQECLSPLWAVKAYRLVSVQGLSGCIQAWPCCQCQYQEAFLQGLQILYRGIFQSSAWSRGVQMPTFRDKIRRQQRNLLRMQTFILSATVSPIPLWHLSCANVTDLKCVKGIFFSRKETSHLLWVTVGET